MNSDTTPNPEKPPEQWVTGREPMTGPQISYFAFRTGEQRAKKAFCDGIALASPYLDGGATRSLAGWGDVVEQAMRYPRHRTEPRPPMVCVKLPKSVLVDFHLFRATKLPYFWD